MDGEKENRKRIARRLQNILRVISDFQEAVLDNFGFAADTNQQLICVIVVNCAFYGLL